MTPELQESLFIQLILLHDDLVEQMAKSAGLRVMLPDKIKTTLLRIAAHAKRSGK